MGIPATGRTVAIQVTDIARIEGGHLKEHWKIVDAAGLIGQLTAPSQ